MIRYPLYVTIDTNIFDSTGYDLGDDGTLGHLYSYVQSGKIKIVLSNIVIREAQKHIKEKAYEIATLSKKLRDEIRLNKLYSDNFVIGIEMGHLIDKVNRNVLAEKAKAMTVLLLLECLMIKTGFIDEVLPEEEVIDLCDVDCMDLVASELIE